MRQALQRSSYLRQPLAPNPAKRQVALGDSLPAPTGGWDAVSSLANMDEDRAIILDNWFPRPDSVEIRKGYKDHATGISTGVVDSLLVYHGLTAAASKLFAATGGSIYDASSEANSGNDSYTKVLLHFEGSDGGTVITDSNLGGSAHTWTANGNANTDDAQEKFGSTSLVCDGTGDYVTTPDHADFSLGSGDWTVDLWFRLAGGDGVILRLAGQADSSLTSTTRTFMITRTAANIIQAQAFVGSTSTVCTGTTTFTTAVNTGWHHVALVRTGDVLKLFIDGTQEGGNQAITGTVNDSSNALSVGRLGEEVANNFNGWIDEFRLSVGVARWTASFTPPTQAYQATSLTGLTNNRFQYVNFTTAGGKFLWICNGVDAPRHYNGSAWATPSISGVTASDIVHVNAHQNRLWFVIKDSTTAAYLATGAVAGTATPFELGGQVIRGGYLVGMGTWTRDGGSGPDDLAVFMFSTGDCIIYQGTDPSSDATWAKIGVFQLSPPIGRRCFQQVAGDLALVTIDGVIPISKALSTDQGAIAEVALTKNINNAMNAAARSYKANFGWELTPYSRGTMALLNVPIAEGSLQHQYVVNTLTGAWCRFTGWDVNTLAVFNDNLYGGTNDGKVIRLDFGGRDGTSEISAIGQAAYSYYKARGILKNFGHVRALVTTASDQRPSLGMSTDFKDNASLGTPTTASISSALYDSAIYDTDIYAIEGRSVTDWTAAQGEGHCASIHFRASTNAVGEVSTKINGFDVTYTRGAFI